MRATTVAAASDVPPRAKKSAAAPGAGTARTSAQMPDNQASMGDRPSRAESSAAPASIGNGQGSPALSTLPEVRTGSSSMTCRRGTIAAGISARRRSIAASASTLAASPPAPT